MSNENTTHVSCQRVAGEIYRRTCACVLLRQESTVAATALLVQHAETGNDLRQGHFCRCEETSSRDCHVELTVRLDRLYVDQVLDQRCYPGVSLAASKKC
jgi:hypothetical protein